MRDRVQQMSAVRILCYEEWPRSPYRRRALYSQEKETDERGRSSKAQEEIEIMAHQLPPLPYDYAALEPFIDAETMHLHHDGHHGAYVKKLNEALEKYPDLQKKSAEDLLRDLNQIPEAIRTAVRNNGGGHVNHTMFWNIMKPKAGREPNGSLVESIEKSFGSFQKFREQFNDAGTKLFGSGWVWLAGDVHGELRILTTPNQDNPLSHGLFPVMGNDLWEHAYYLKYKNKRPEYLEAWWNVVNWDEIQRRYEKLKTRQPELATAGG
jgi:superoxide dismutase, Fe-Mn family